MEVDKKGAGVDEGLLEALGISQTTTAQTYDFSLPRRMPKDQYAGLHAAHTAMAKLLTSYFTTLLRTLVEVKLKAVDYTGYGAFIERRREPDCLWTFEVANSQGMGLVGMEPAFVSLLVDRLFGGHGHPHNQVRPTTAIEQSLMSRVIERILNMWDQCWQNWVQIKSTLRLFETNPTLVQIAARNEPVISVRFDVEIRRDAFPLVMCMPFAMMSPLLNVLKDQSWTLQSPKKKDPKDRMTIQYTLLRTEIPVQIQLGKTKISLKDYLSLEEGDVILLRQRVRDPLRAIVGDRTKFWVVPGVLNNRKAAKVTSVCKDEEIRID